MPSNEISDAGSIRSLNHDSIVGRTVHPGSAAGEAITLDEPLSLWGGMDISTGVISDVKHPQCARSITNKIMIMEAGRGSSSSSSALVEAVRKKTAPQAIILARVDGILAIGALVAANLYGVQIPIVVVGLNDWPNLLRLKQLRVEADWDMARIQPIQYW